MDNMLSKIDKKIISLISQDIPLVKEPFKDLAGRLGIDERTLLERIHAFKKDALMRKFSASLNHRKIGFLYNAMVVWDVPEKLIDKAGGIMASFDEVSHCYQREKRPGWSYNLYSMVHGRTKSECIGVVKRISNALGRLLRPSLRGHFSVRSNLKRPRNDVIYKVLFSSKEYKKTGVRY